MQTITAKDCAVRLQSFNHSSRTIPLHILRNALHYNPKGKAYLRAFLPGPDQRVQLLECIHPFILSNACNEYLITCIASKVSIKQSSIAQA